MANIASQKKRNRQNEKRRLRNKGVRSELKTRIRRVHEAVAEGDAEGAAEAARRAQRSLGKAAAKGIVHKNAAARRQSRVARAAHTSAD